MCMFFQYILIHDLSGRETAPESLGLVLALKTSAAAALMLLMLPGERPSAVLISEIQFCSFDGR